MDVPKNKDSIILSITVPAGTYIASAKASIGTTVYALNTYAQIHLTSWICEDWCLHDGTPPTNAGRMGMSGIFTCASEKTIELIAYQNVADSIRFSGCSLSIVKIK